MLKVYKKLLNYVPEKRYLIILSSLFSVVAAGLQIVALYNLYIFLKKLIIKNEVSQVVKYAAIFAGILLCGAFCYFTSLMLSHLFAFRLETNLRKHGIEGLSRASFRFFDMNSSGRTRKILDDNAAKTHMAVAHLIPDNTGALLLPIFALILGYAISLRVGIVLTVLIVVSVFLISGMTGEQSFMKAYTESLERLSSETVEYIRGMQVIKIFGVDVRSFKALNNAIKEYAKLALNYSMSCKTSYVLYQTLFFSIIAILIPIILLFTNVDSDPRRFVVELIMLFLLSGAMFNYMLKIMYISMYMFQARDAIDKLESLYTEMQENKMSFGTETNFDNYNIEFDNVTFSYTDKPVFENMSFKLESGKSYALVGASGSGKSTVVKLISGFYRVNKGVIKIGGKPLENYSEDAIIKNIAFVFQEPKLFKISLYENVALANDKASKEEVLKAMQLAGCDSIIKKFKDRENTIIGSKGVYLSGGEKQRIAIARAILKDAKIIIFDEASAAIDPENEHELQKAFSNLMKDKTVIMIAHRLTSIKNVDEILVFENGKIIERGNDSKLMSLGKVYRHFQDMYAQANDWRVLNEKLS